MAKLRTISIDEKKNGYISNDEQVYTIIKEENINVELCNSKEVCIILGVEKTAKGTLKYLVQLKNENMEENFLVDSYILRKMCPQMVIDFYEKITIWT